MGRVAGSDPFIDLSKYSGKDLGWEWLKLGDWPASWVDHPERPLKAASVAVFRLNFECAAASKVRFRVSADNRYHLYLDGKPLGRGPERGDVLHWRFETYEEKLSPGKHVFAALSWWLGDVAPVAQISVRPGLLFAAEGDWHERLSTGVAPWEVMLVDGFEYMPVDWVGARVRIDGARFPWGWQTGAGAGWVAAKAIVQGMSASLKNQIPPYWLMTPATLAPMRETSERAGRVRHLAAKASPYPVAAQDNIADEVPAWDAWLAKGSALTIPPHAVRTAVIDLDNYYCAYPVLRVSGGRGTRIKVSWAEALFLKTEGYEKGNRDGIEGKYFRGPGDEFLPDGGDGREFTPLWWAAGRYVEIVVTTADEPLLLESLTFSATGYPVKMEGSFRASDERFEEVTPIALRTLQMCSHETYFDCPYYEQLMYAGDTRLEVLVTYCMTHDDRLPAKAVTMFDDSRRLSGFTRSCYPCNVAQIIPPFSLWWMMMVRDYWMWRGNEEFIRKRMPGVRSCMEAFYALIREDGLMGAPTGWNYVDWVDKPVWNAGMPKDAALGISSILNLQLLLALQAKASIEADLGEGLLAKRDRTLAANVMRAVLKHFWDSPRGMIADDLAHERFSEHAQCLAIISGLLPKDKARRVAKGLVEAPDLQRTTIYFSHYLFEALYRIGNISRLMERLDMWFGLERLGFKTTLEQPEPSRSDCHAWASHPLYHYYATFLGIRPDAPGFSRVRIAPMLPEHITWIEGRMPHPAGEVSVALRRKNGKLTGEVTLPAGVKGTFVWSGKERALKSGKTKIG